MKYPEARIAWDRLQNALDDACCTVYRRILGIEAPWYVESVELKPEAGEIHVQLRHADMLDWPCPNYPPLAVAIWSPNASPRHPLGVRSQTKRLPDLGDSNSPLDSRGVGRTGDEAGRAG